MSMMQTRSNGRFDQLIAKRNSHQDLLETNVPAVGEQPGRQNIERYEATALQQQTMNMSNYQKSRAIGANEVNLRTSQSKPNRTVEKPAILVKKASPCPVAWTELSGSDRVRWCNPCGHYVYNPNRISVDELMSVISFQEGFRPEYLYKREDGTLLSKNCLVGTRKAQKLGALLTGGIAILLVVFSMSFAGRPSTDNASASIVKTAAANEVKEDRATRSSGNTLTQQNEPARLTTSTPQYSNPWKPWTTSNSSTTSDLAEELADAQQKQLDIQSTGKPAESNAGLGSNASQAVVQPAPPGQAQVAQQSPVVTPSQASQPSETGKQQSSQPATEQATAQEAQPAPQARPSYVWDARVAAGSRR